MRFRPTSVCKPDTLWTWKRRCLYKLKPRGILILIYKTASWNTESFCGTKLVWSRLATCESIFFWKKKKKNSFQYRLFLIVLLHKWAGNMIKMGWTNGAWVTRTVNLLIESTDSLVTSHYVLYQRKSAAIWL